MPFKYILYLLIVIVQQAVAQNVGIDEKYQIYKHRFETEFLTSTENPHKTGAFLPVEYINSKGEKFTGDEVWYLGLYLAVLSTEYHLNTKNNRLKEAEQNLNQIRNILITLDRLDTAAERYFGKKAKLNGFFVRNDSQPNSGFNSQDQIWNTFYGFKMLKKFVGDTAIIAHMQAISIRFLNSMYSVVEEKNGKQVRKWRILDPNGKVLQKPEEMLVSKYAFCKIASDLADSNLFLPGSDNMFSRFMSSSARMGMYHRTTLRKHSHVYNTYGIAILTMMAFPEKGYKFSAKIERIAMKHFPKGTFSHISLSSCILYNHKPLQNKEFYTGILENAPVSGPAYGLKNEWNSLNLLACPWQDSWKGRYNGLDFMLLHNLVKIVFGEQKK